MNKLVYQPYWSDFVQKILHRMLEIKVLSLMQFWKSLIIFSFISQKVAQSRPPR